MNAASEQLIELLNLEKLDMNLFAELEQGGNQYADFRRACDCSVACGCLQDG